MVVLLRRTYKRAKILKRINEQGIYIFPNREHYAAQELDAIIRCQRTGFERVVVREINGRQNIVVDCVSLQGNDSMNVELAASYLFKNGRPLKTILEEIQNERGEE